MAKDFRRQHRAFRKATRISCFLELRTYHRVRRLRPTPEIHVVGVANDLLERAIDGEEQACLPDLELCSVDVS